MLDVQHVSVGLVQDAAVDQKELLALGNVHVGLLHELNGLPNLIIDITDETGLECGTAVFAEPRGVLYVRNGVALQLRWLYW